MYVFTSVSVTFQQSKWHTTGILDVENSDFWSANQKISIVEPRFYDDITTEGKQHARLSYEFNY